MLLLEERTAVSNSLCHTPAQAAGDFHF
jgi:hypothetical protein